MQAGKLRHRVQLTTKTVTRGTNGEEIVTYPVIDTLWANVEVVGGGETIAQQQAAATLTHQVTVRYYSGLEPTMRLNWLRGDGTARTLVITAPPIEDASRRQMILNCSELV